MSELVPNTFHMDFAIAEVFGIEAVKDTFNRAFNEWKNNYMFLTALVVVMNHRCWLHYENKNMELSNLYCDYYYKTREYALDNLTGKEFDYFYDITD